MRNDTVGHALGAQFGGSGHFPGVPVGGWPTGLILPIEVGIANLTTTRDGRGNTFPQGATSQRNYNRVEIEAAARRRNGCSVCLQLEFEYPPGEPGPADINLPMQPPNYPYRPVRFFVDLWVNGRHVNLAMIAPVGVVSPIPNV
jgi:hypothetical protein